VAGRRPCQVDDRGAGGGPSLEPALAYLEPRDPRARLPRTTRRGLAVSAGVEPPLHPGRRGRRRRGAVVDQLGTEEVDEADGDRRGGPGAAGGGGGGRDRRDRAGSKEPTDSAHPTSTAAPSVGRWRQRIKGAEGARPEPTGKRRHPPLA